MSGQDGKATPDQAREIAAIRRSAGTARQPVDETRDTPVEPPLAMEVQGDLPGLDDNSRRDSAPGFDKAREIADVRPVGAAPDPRPADSAEPRGQAAAFRDGKAAAPKGSDVQVRPAGAEETRDDEPSDWDEVDQAADESFPASDPPARY